MLCIYVEKRSKLYIFERGGHPPWSDDGPTAVEHHGRVDDETGAQSLWVVLAEQPDEVLDKLVVHVGGAEVLHVKHDAQVVNDVLIAALARTLLGRK